MNLLCSNQAFGAFDVTTRNILYLTSSSIVEFGQFCWKWPQYCSLSCWYFNWQCHAWDSGIGCSSSTQHGAIGCGSIWSEITSWVCTAPNQETILCFRSRSIGSGGWETWNWKVFIFYFLCLSLLLWFRIVCCIVWDISIFLGLQVAWC